MVDGVAAVCGVLVVEFECVFLCSRIFLVALMLVVVFCSLVQDVIEFFGECFYIG